MLIRYGRQFRGVAVVGGLALAVVLAVGVAASAQENRDVKRVPITPEQARLSAGSELYAALCASCHGAEGKGDGPAAAALKEPVPDLTLLAERNGGEFPELRVKNSILGAERVAAHGSREMPVWGDVFSRTTHSAAIAELHAYALMEHLKSIQAGGK